MTESKGISRSDLKIIAVLAMLLDHIGASLMQPYLTAAAIHAGVTSWSMGSLISACPKQAIPYYVLRLIGRIAFPIFCFLLVEGFLHTRNLKKYCIRLALFALISEAPFDLAFHRTLFYSDSQNVFFTLLIGLLTIWGIQSVKHTFPGQINRQAFFRILILLLGMGAAWLLKTDYDYTGVLIIDILYELHSKRTSAMSLSCLFLCFMSTLELSAFAAVPFVKCYNGKRGLSLFQPKGARATENGKGRVESMCFKYFFYLFYPVHLLLLYLIYCYCNLP